MGGTDSNRLDTHISIAIQENVPTASLTGQSDRLIPSTEVLFPDYPSLFKVDKMYL